MRTTIASVGTLLLGVAILLAGQGLQGVLLPVRATMEQFSTVLVAFIGATYYLGFTYGCWKGPEIIQRVGHVRVFAAMTALASVSPLLHGLWVNPWSWGVLRFITGFCFAVLYIVIESWLNERASNKSRGQVFSAYILINMTFLAVGQQMLLLQDPLRLDLFAIASVLVSIAAVPVLMSRADSPEIREQGHSIDFRALYHTSPAGMLGSLAAGLTNGAFWALAAVFAAQVSTDVSFAAWLMTMAVIGGALGQFPLGSLSDRVDRRRVLIGISFASSLAGLLIWMVASHASTVQLLVFTCAWGVVAYPIYSISAAHANDRTRPEDFVMVSSGLLLMFGLGAVVGPFLASGLMAILDASGLFFFTAVIHLLLGLHVWLRSLRRDAASPEQHTEFSDALTAVITVSNVLDEENSEGHE